MLNNIPHLDNQQLLALIKADRILMAAYEEDLIKIKKELIYLREIVNELRK